MFCPFVNGNCISDCVFNDHKFDGDSSENCTLSVATRNMQAAEFFERTPKDYLESMESMLYHIDNNTSKDQTDSCQINEKLGCVLDKLNSVLDMM